MNTTLRNLLGFTLLAAIVLAMACQCFGGAPTVSLYVVPETSSSGRMAPCVVTVRVDYGALDKSIVNASYAWTNSSGSEYKLGTTLANLTDSGDAPSNIIVRENGTMIPEGTVGSLAASEWGQTGGELYIRLSDGTDPDSKATDYVDITFDVSLSGQGGSTNVGGSSPGWTNTTGSEYSLDTAVNALAASIPDNCRLRVREGSGLSGAHLERGIVGSLAAGEYCVQGEVLHVRLSDSSNPDSASAGDVVLEYELYPSALHIAWEVNSSGSGIANWGSRYRYSTDPRSELSSAQIDHAGKQSNANGPNGMGYSWLLDVADTYTFSATITNTDGDATVETTSGVTVAADSRTEYNVAALGGDDTSLAALIGTIGASTHDVKIIIEDGHTENFTAPVTAITGDNWWITTETTSGTKPILTYSDATDTGYVDFFSVNGENFVAERIELAESTGNTGAGNEGGKIAISGWDVEGTNSAFLECGVNGNDLDEGSGGLRLASAWVVNGCSGLLIQNCETEFTRSYSLIRGNTTSGDSVAALGNTFGPSTNESVIRVLGGTSHWTINWNSLTGDGSKSNLRWFGGRYMSAYGNSSADGDNWTGSQLANRIAVYSVRQEANKFTGSISAKGLLFGMVEGVEGCFGCNNIVSSGTAAWFNLGADTDGSGDGLKKIGTYLGHNTLIGEDGFNNDYIRGETVSQLYQSRNRVANNLFVHEDAADMTAYLVDIGDANAVFNGNVWPATQTGLHHFARIYVSNTIDRYSTDLTAWNAESFVGTDTETDVTLDSEYTPSSPTSVTTEPGVHHDYYGWDRGATSYAGAVDQYGEQGPTFNTFIPGVLIRQP